MKRDLNLVRQILLAIEQSPSGFAPRQLVIDGYTDEQIGYHVHLMKEAGLVEASDTTGFKSSSPEAIARQLTWSGHEFLDAARDDVRWTAALALATAKAGTFTFDVLKQLLVAALRGELGLP